LSSNLSTKRSWIGSFLRYSISSSMAPRAGRLWALGGVFSL
jgi:hypothetical protein